MSSLGACLMCSRALGRECHKFGFTGSFTRLDGKKKSSTGREWGNITSRKRNLVGTRGAHPRLIDSRVGSLRMSANVLPLTLKIRASRVESFVVVDSAALANCGVGLPLWLPELCKWGHGMYLDRGMDLLLGNRMGVSVRLPYSPISDPRPR